VNPERLPKRERQELSKKIIAAVSLWKKDTRLTSGGPLTED
jgi:hypothetical protein